jgi:hypothetical protein
MKLYLGVWNVKHALNAPQFMFSLRRLKKRVSALPFGDMDWIMDSGAFTEISINGKYTFTPQEYLHYIELHQPKIFFNKDFMCEPSILKKTGMTVKQHQEKTIDNQIKIMNLLENYNINSVFAGCIQGWEISDYLNHIDMLKQGGLITSKMGVGSVCRRNSKSQILEILQAVKQELPNTKLHGFGIKTDILKEPLVYKYLDSCDSMAWSFAGRKIKSKPCPVCEYTDAKNCANCYRFMLKWYKRLQDVQDITIKQKTPGLYNDNAREQKNQTGLII